MYHLKQEIAGKKTRTNMCTKYPKNTLSPFHYYSGESCDNSIDEYSKNQAHIDEHISHFSNDGAISNLLDKCIVTATESPSNDSLLPPSPTCIPLAKAESENPFN